MIDQSYLTVLKHVFDSYELKYTEPELHSFMYINEPDRKSLAAIVLVTSGSSTPEDAYLYHVSGPTVGDKKKDQVFLEIKSIYNKAKKERLVVDSISRELCRRFNQWKSLQGGRN
jgi:hypothetical protein